MNPPEGLEERHVAAWTALTAGGSYKDAAAAANVSTGTVARWIKRWRVQHGDDLFRDEARQADAQRTERAREAAEVFWTDLRRTEARALGATASRIRHRIAVVLEDVGTSRVDRGPNGTSVPVVVKGTDAREVKALADAAVKLIEAAELLDDRPTRHLRRSVPADQWINPATPAGPQGSTDADLQRAVMSDPELAEQFAALAEQAWARAHPEDR